MAYQYYCYISDQWYQNGNDGSASTSITIKEYEKDDVPPDTGDTSNSLWFILLLVSGAGLLLAGLTGVKKQVWIEEDKIIVTYWFEVKTVNLLKAQEDCKYDNYI